MSALLIKNIPEELHQRLKTRATARGRSMAREVLWILEQAVSDRAGPPPLAAIDQLRVRGNKLLTQEILDEARNDGRP